MYSFFSCKPNFAFSTKRCTEYIVLSSIMVLCQPAQLWTKLANIHSRGFQFCGKVVLFVSYCTLTMFLAIRINSAPLSGQDSPNLTFYILKFEFFCKINTHCWKLCRKVVFSGPLGHLIRFWPFQAQFCLKWAKFDLLHSKFQNFA